MSITCYCATVGLAGKACPVCGKVGGFGVGSRDLSTLPAKLDRKALRAMGAKVQGKPRPSPAPVQVPRPVVTVPATRAGITQAARAFAQAAPPAAMCPTPAPVVPSAARPVVPAVTGRAVTPATVVRDTANTASTRPGSLHHGPAHLALRAAHAARDYNLALAMLIGLTGGPAKDQRIAQLASIDAWGAEHGELTKAHVEQRKVIGAACVGELGYNPRTHDAPGIPAGQLYGKSAPVKAAPVQSAPTPAPDARPASAEGAPVSDYSAARQDFAAPTLLLEAPPGPLMSGDWAGLAKRVQRGELTEAEARAFGELWASGRVN